MTLAALGNADQVMIMEVRPYMFSEFMTIERPKYYYNLYTNSQEPFKPIMPSISWGYGMCPSQFNKPHSILAVAWGPLIQLIKLIDYETVEEPLVIDGHYILR